MGFDGTAASLDAIAYAIGWSRRLRGQLDVLYVADRCWQWISDACAAVGPSVAVPDREVDVSALVGNAVRDLLAGTELPWSYHTALGPVADALEAHADSVGADVIIIGRSRRCRRYARSPSTTDRLLRCARRIVIVVP